MRHQLFAIATLTLAAFTLTNAAAEDKPNDTLQEKLQGRWEIVAGVNQGRELSPTEVSGTYVTIITNSMVTYDRDNQARYQAVFTIDEQEKPAQITLRAVAKNPPTRPNAVNRSETSSDRGRIRSP